MVSFRFIANLFLFLSVFYAESNATEWTLSFRSGRFISDIKPKFYKKDIFILRHSDKTEELVSVDSLVYVRREDGPYTVPGVIFGGIGGGVVGGLIGSASAGEGGGHPNLGPMFATMGGAAVGMLVGGVLGGIIGGNIKSDDTVDLSDADVNFKVETLKKLVH